MASKKVKVGIVGFGSLGKYLAQAILKDAQVSERCELAFVWNRTADKIPTSNNNDGNFFVPQELVLHDLNDFASRKADLIVEVCHPQIISEYGAKFLEQADFIAGSPTAFANSDVEKQLRGIATSGKFGCYIPSGALWGAEDIEKMASRGTLAKLTITMKKHPSSLKVDPILMTKINDYINNKDVPLLPNGDFVVFEGSVRELCPLAPNNVNTMACAALAAHNLGFDVVKARLVANKTLEAHVIDIDVEGMVSLIS